MLTIAQKQRELRRFVTLERAALRALDSQVEALQRWEKRVISRKQQLLDATDGVTLGNLAKSINAKYVVWVKSVNDCMTALST